jgi:hypothetical protein
LTPRRTSVNICGMTNLTCRSCGRDSGVPEPKASYNVGELAKASGFHPILCANGGIRWVCQDCKAVIEGHADAIYQMTCTRYAYINNLMSKGLREKADAENDEE